MTSRNNVKIGIFTIISSLLSDKSIIVTDETPLIGAESALDSMKLVELCLSLEDMGLDLGFDFDWTSAAAMSKSRSMFRTAGSLSAEFINQMDLKK